MAIRTSVPQQVHVSASSTPRSLVVTLDELVRLPMIGYRDGACRTVVEGIFHATAELPTFVFRSDDNPTIQGCVASGIGYWATPLLTVDLDDPSVAVLPIEPAPEPRHIALAWAAGRRAAPAVAALVDVAAAVCQDVEDAFPAALRGADR